MPDNLGDFDPQKTYSDAAQAYEVAARRYWEFLSTRTVERLALRPGDAVLDVACGTGPATVAAAQAVGPQGRVVAVDYAEGMLAIAREKVESLGLTNAEFVQADMTQLDLEPDAFDAVICVLGIFFVEDVAAQTKLLWSLVRPGGRLAVTVLGKEIFAPMIDPFGEAARRERPDLEVIQPWRRTEDTSVLRAALESGGVSGVEIVSERDDLPFAPEDWWGVVMGSGLRWTAAELGDAADSVREDNERWARDNAIDRLSVSAHYATARKG
jgi:ubiquinone/menaquinone biosynthesis C-methylase UbiE